MKNVELRIDGQPQPVDESRRDVTRSDREDKPEEEKTTHDRVVDQLREVFDPEIPVNIYELGLIYDIDIDDDKNVKITMTLTSPACPVAESLPGEVRASAGRVPEVKRVEIDLVWEPQWTPDRMSEVAKLKLGML